ncbi:hypothetical protein F7725_010734, partial [Dissostichus mawsoni]
MFDAKELQAQGTVTWKGLPGAWSSPHSGSGWRLRAVDAPPSACWFLTGDRRKIQDALESPAPREITLLASEVNLGNEAKGPPIEEVFETVSTRTDDISQSIFTFDGPSMVTDSAPAPALTVFTTNSDATPEQRHVISALLGPSTAMDRPPAPASRVQILNSAAQRQHILRYYLTCPGDAAPARCPPPGPCAPPLPQWPHSELEGAPGDVLVPVLHVHGVRAHLLRDEAHAVGAVFPPDDLRVLRLSSGTRHLSRHLLAARLTYSPSPGSLRTRSPCTDPPPAGSPPPSPPASSPRPRLSDLRPLRAGVGVAAPREGVRETLLSRHHGLLVTCFPLFFTLTTTHGSSCPDGAVILAVRLLRSVSVIFRETSDAVPTNDGESRRSAHSAVSQPGAERRHMTAVYGVHGMTRLKGRSIGSIEAGGVGSSVAWNTEGEEEEEEEERRKRRRRKRKHSRKQREHQRPAAPLGAVGGRHLTRDFTFPSMLSVHGDDGLLPDLDDHQSEQSLILTTDHQSEQSLILTTDHQSEQSLILTTDHQSEQSLILTTDHQSEQSLILTTDHQSEQSLILTTDHQSEQSLILTTDHQSEQSLILTTDHQSEQSLILSYYSTRKTSE